MNQIPPTTAPAHLEKTALQNNARATGGMAARKVSMGGTLWNTSVGMKLVVASTGVVLLLFVIGHLLGNLQIFLGQEALNAYAEKLRAFPPLLYTIRGVLAVIAIVHVGATLILAVRNRRARPAGYLRKEPVKATLSSRTMVISGLMVLAFVLYHLMHFTWHVTNPAYTKLLDAGGNFDVYSMVVLGFQNVYISGVYIIAMILLGYHLRHATASLFQTLGWGAPGSRALFERLAFLLTAIIVIGNISIPVSVLLGLIKLPAGGM